MTFFESACLIASQMFANWLVGNNMEKNSAPSSAVIFLAIICFIFLTRGWTEAPTTTSFKEYSLSFYACIFGGKLTAFLKLLYSLFSYTKQFIIYLFFKKDTLFVKEEKKDTIFQYPTFLWKSDNLFITMNILELQRS
jgi:hypothetical protein